jgi:hypothetical protein
MVATNIIIYDWFQTGIWFSTGTIRKDTEMHYPIGMFMDRFTAGTNARPAAAARRGNVFVRQLCSPARIDPRSNRPPCCSKTRACACTCISNIPPAPWQSWGGWGNRYLWLRLTGPGRVAVQSNFEHMEDPGNPIRSTEPMTTTHQW